MFLVYRESRDNCFINLHLNLSSDLYLIVKWLSALVNWSDKLLLPSRYTVSFFSSLPLDHWASCVTCVKL